MTKRDVCRYCKGWSDDMILHEENCVMRPIKTEVIGHRDPRYPGEPRSRREIRKLIKP